MILVKLEAGAGGGGELYFIIDVWEGMFVWGVLFALVRGRKKYPPCKTDLGQN